MALKGRQYTVTATAVAPLKAASGILGAIDPSSDTQPGHIPIMEISFKAAAANGGDVFIGNSNVTAAPTNALIKIEKGTGFTSGPFTGNVSIYADDFYVVGTANDIVHIYAVPY